MMDLNIDPSLIQQQASRRVERVQTLQMVNEKLPRRKAKGSELARLWTLLEETHELLLDYDIQADPPAIAEALAGTFGDIATHLYATLSQDDKPAPAES